jgi:hypothetical protein
MGIDGGEISRRTVERVLLFDGTNAYIDADFSGFNIVGFEPEAGIGVTTVTVSRQGIANAGFVAADFAETVVSGEFRALTSPFKGYGCRKVRLTANATPAAGKKLGVMLST